MLTLKNLKKTYRPRRDMVIPAVDGVSLTIGDGEMVAIVGHSGAGKSTLLNLMAGLDLCDEGKILLNEKALNTRSAAAMARYRNENIGFIVQHYGLLDDLTVLENVLLPLKYSRKTAIKRQGRKRARLLLKTVGVLEQADKYPPELSGGECQRAAIARALICEPSLLLADEPTGSLDADNEEIILQIFRNLAEQGKSVVIVTHDESVAQQCDRIIRMENGIIIASAENKA